VGLALAAWCASHGRWRLLPGSARAARASMACWPQSWHRDGPGNAIEFWALTHLSSLWRFLAWVPRLRFRTNRLLINKLVYKMNTRPNALSTMAPYTSWASLTDRTFSDRHLPPDPLLQQRLPTVEAVAELFRRHDCQPIVSAKSTLLFPHFAQWFTDGFLRTDPDDAKKNTSTQDIDLSQLYGQTACVTDMLRSRSGGRLKSELICGGEYPPLYHDACGNVKPEFANLKIVPGDSKTTGKPPPDPHVWADRKLFALGIPRGNVHYGFVMMSTLFLREHNRVAGMIAAEHPDWDDERIFQTTRNTMIVLLLKIVIEDYINHITPFKFQLFVEPGIGASEKWYRENWLSMEFNLLYRWHTLVPSAITVGGQEHDMSGLLWDNRIVLAWELGALFDEASRQPSMEVTLFNTAPFLVNSEVKAITIGREVQLASYNDYREACGYPRAASFAQISSQRVKQRALRRRYASVEDIELYVGLFGEDVQPGAALPTLMATMVAVDAFSQALTNPLLAEGIYGEATFSAAGMRAIEATHRLADIVARNVAGQPLVTFQRESAGGQS